MNKNETLWVVNGLTNTPVTPNPTIVLAKDDSVFLTW